MLVHLNSPSSFGVMISGDVFSSVPTFSFVIIGVSNRNSMVDSGVSESVLMIKSDAEVALVSAMAIEASRQAVFMADRMRLSERREGGDGEDETLLLKERNSIPARNDPTDFRHGNRALIKNVQNFRLVTAVFSGLFPAWNECAFIAGQIVVLILCFGRPQRKSGSSVRKADLALSMAVAA